MISPGSALTNRRRRSSYVGPNKQFLTEQFEPRVMALLDEAPTLADKLARGNPGDTHSRRAAARAAAPGPEKGGQWPLYPR